MTLCSWVVSGGALLEFIILICVWIKQKMTVLTLTKIGLIAGMLYWLAFCFVIVHQNIFC